VQLLVAIARSASEALDVLQREAERLAGQFQAVAPWSQGQASQPQELDDEPIDQAILRELGAGFEGFADRFEQATNQELLAQRGGLIRLLGAGEEALRNVPGVLRAAARWEITQALKEIDVARLVLGHLDEPATAGKCLDQFIAAAWPRLLQCGGAKRLLLLMPPCSTSERVPGLVVEHRHETPNVLFAPGGELVACYEGEQISLTDAAAFLVRDDPQFAAVAKRVHTRSDIQWCSL
jgi:hypothetical protein